MANFLADYLARITPVPFSLQTPEETLHIGNGESYFTASFSRLPGKRALLTNTSLALGEAYMHGDLTLDRDLYEVLDQFVGQMPQFKHNDLALRRLLYPSTAKSHQQQEVCSHYDLGNDFYALWLDESLSYSCAYYTKEQESLAEAQIAKVDHSLAKLALKPGMKLLDIGCGWGFLLKRAIELYDVQAVGITLSHEQYAKCREDIQKEHLEAQMSVYLLDYRDLPSLGLTFDRVISIGMLEHVGRDNYGLFLQSVQQILRPGGLFLLHFISALQEHPGNAWLKKYIFPGGTIPSLREIMTLMGDNNWHTLSVESLRPHYNRTLLAWRENFNQKRELIVQKYGEEFARMWDFYLAGCAAGFHHGIVDVHQILMSNGLCDLCPWQN